MDHEIPLKAPDKFFSNNMSIDLNDELCLAKEDGIFDQEILDNYAAQIHNAKYEQVDTNKVAVAQKQLNINQCHELQYLLANNKKIMDLLVSISTTRSLLTYCLVQKWYTTTCNRYLCPWTNIQKELQNMVDIGILDKCGASEWASACFIVAKKDDQVIQISDLQSLDKCFKYKQYLLSIAHDIML